MSERAWGFYLDDMIKFCKKVMSYTERLDQKGFETDEKIYDATLRNLDLLGEAATHIPDALILENRFGHFFAFWEMQHEYQ